MLKYIFKNLKSQFTKQGVISLLLVINIIVSALVICFSYGLYQNYNIIINEGETTDISDLRIDIYDEYRSVDPDSPATTEVTVGMVKNFLYMLDDDTVNDIDYFSTLAGFETDLFYVEGTNEIGYYTQIYYLGRNNGNITSTFRHETKYVSDDMYNNGDKVAVLGNGLFDDYPGRLHNSIAGTSGGANYYIIANILSPDVERISINGESYTIVGRFGDNFCEEIRIPFTSLPDDTKISARIEIKFKEGVHLTESAYNDILKCVKNTMGDYVYVPEIEIPETTEIYFYKTILIISLFIAILAAINMAILYRYILEKRSAELAILRICGCSKRKAVRMYLLECMLVNAPLFALTEYAYHKLIMPKLTGLFPHMEGAYSKKLYLVIFAMYVTVSLVILIAMITSLISKHSLVEQKNNAKAKSRFGIMKVFEILQLSVVMGIVVFIVSAIVSRYTYYLPFKDILNSEGYLVSSPTSVYYEELEEICLGADLIQYTNGNIALNTSDNSSIDTVCYDDVLCDAIIPNMKEGVWLSETNCSFVKDGVIPIVITDNLNYNLGDEIISTIQIYDAVNYNELIEEYEVVYKVVGVLENNTMLVGRLSMETKSIENFKDFYTLYDYEFFEKEYAFAKLTDVKNGLNEIDDLYSKQGTVSDIQFIITENLSNEERAQVEQTLLNNGMSITPLSEVNENSLEYIYEQMYTLFPIALCIFILTVISAVSINAIYTKRQLRNYAIFYICGARWRTCALKSLKDSAITCAVASSLCALILFIGKQSFLKETVISFGIWHAVICLGVIVLYLLLSMIMPIAIIGSSQPQDVLKEE